MKAKLLFLFLALIVSSLAIGQSTSEVVYDFTGTDGAALITAGQSTDGSLTLSGTYSQHNNDPGSAYGLNLKVDAVITIAVDGPSTITFLGSQYSSLDVAGTAAPGGDLGTQVGQVTNDLVDTYEFEYNGYASTLSFTAVDNSGSGTDLYLPQITVTTQNFLTKIDAWDFAATQLNTDTYTNHLDEAGINAWTANPAGTSGVNVPLTWTAGGLTWTGTSATSDRLRTTNLNLTRFDENTKGDFAGRLYVNSAAKADRNLSISLNEGDELTLWMWAESAPGEIHFQYVSDPLVQDDIVTAPLSEQTEVKFTANATGVYKVYDGAGKPSYMRVYRKPVVLATVSGTVDESAADGIPAYSIVFKNAEGKERSAVVTAGAYSIDLPAGFTYEVSLDAAGYKITNTSSIDVIDGTPATFDFVASVAKTEIDVWDFGAEQLTDTETIQYNNILTEQAINAWYDPLIEVGSSGNVMPETFTAANFVWTGGTNDRLRTTNTNLTRYDTNTKGDFAGRLYINSTGATGRFFTVTLDEDDELTLWMYAENADGQLHFQYDGDPLYQDDIATVPISTITEVKFVAKATGTYSIFDEAAKPSYFRIYRQDAVYATITGTVDETNAPGIPGGYSVVFTNEAGKAKSTVVNAGAYTVDLPIGYSYELSLADANGYVIATGKTLDVTESTTTHDLQVVQVDLYTVSGNLTGLGAAVADLTLVYTADPAANKIFVPEPEIDAVNSTYTVELEANVEYTISAEGVNDYTIPTDKITITDNTTADIVFAAKPTYTVTPTIVGLDATELAALTLTFSNLNEEGYVYSFASGETITLRDGTYGISYSGLDDYPVELSLTSNLVVNGADATKTLTFVPVTNWTFDDRDISGLTSYKGLMFTGDISNQPQKSHLTAKPAATIQVPVSVGDKVSVYYYYAANFTIEAEGPYETTSGTTSILESADYVYTGTDAGFVTITFGGAATSYVTDIFIAPVVDFAAQITVGNGKDYATINDALEAVRNMVRENDERVTILIDAGNYEEMLVVDVPNVTFKNADATPTIGILNAGVDISEGAVRITSYYGHGYNYYSMGPDQKWNADILAVNIENGSQPYENTGAGTTNGSYWNGTVVVSASGFQAENIIFENSFNQYISQKESEDVVVEKSDAPVGGTRPTTVGSTAVQDRPFVERAAALSIGNNVDKVILNNCRIVGRQDSFYGGRGSRVAIYHGAYMGAVDYIFGGMTVVFYKSDLVMNVSDVSSDAAYLTAAQQDAGRGYLMYETTVTSAEPGVETASTFRAKPGYFGRPWQPVTSEVVFYNTTVETSDFTDSEGLSLIQPAGWTNSLGGESTSMYEFGTIEESGIDNSGNRAAWSTVLTEPLLTDGTEITPFNFTKGDDDWDPFALLIDTNNSLASLSVAEGALSPAFDADVVSYDVEVPYGTEDVTIVATAESQYAEVEIGEFSSLPGSATVTVTADDGSTKVYTINVTLALPLSVEDQLENAYGLSLYPNPSEVGTTLSFSLPSSEMVGISIIDFSGKVVRNVMNSRMSEGEHQVHLETNYLKPGIYFCSFNTSNTKQSVTFVVK